MEGIIRSRGAIPATVAILAGRPHVGLTPGQLEGLAKAGPRAKKCSKRDLAVVMAQVNCTWPPRGLFRLLYSILYIKMSSSAQKSKSSNRGKDKGERSGTPPEQKHGLGLVTTLLFVVVQSMVVVQWCILLRRAIFRWANVCLSVMRGSPGDGRFRPREGKSLSFSANKNNYRTMEFHILYCNKYVKLQIRFHSPPPSSNYNAKRSLD